MTTTTKNVDDNDDDVNKDNSDYDGLTDRTHSPDIEILMRGLFVVGVIRCVVSLGFRFQCSQCVALNGDLRLCPSHNILVDDI